MRPPYLPYMRPPNAQEFDDWLARPTDPAHRAFVVLGSAGVGKSAFASLLAVSRPEVVAAVHFCTVADAATRGAHAFVASVAFQLACRVPGFAPLLAEAADGISGSGGGGGVSGGGGGGDGSGGAADSALGPTEFLFDTLLKVGQGALLFCRWGGGGVMLPCHFYSTWGVTVILENRLRVLL